MIRHENADAMVLASALMRGIHPPGRSPIGLWRQHFDDELRLRPKSEEKPTSRSSVCLYHVIWSWACVVNQIN